MDAEGGGRSTWQQVGRQLRAGPTVTAAPAVDPVRVSLTWTAVDARAWTPATAVSYTVYRGTGGTVETVATGVGGLEHLDGGMDSGAAYTYEVAAVVDDGEAVRSVLVTAEVPCAYAVAPLHRDVLWPAGTGELAVTTGGGRRSGGGAADVAGRDRRGRSDDGPSCAWTAASESGFLTVTSGAAGTGSATVTYALATNAGSPRTGALLVAGQR